MHGEKEKEEQNSLLVLYVRINHITPVVTNDQTRQLVLYKDHIRMRFSFSLIRINFRDAITTFNPYITINSNHNYLFEYNCLQLFHCSHCAYVYCVLCQCQGKAFKKSIQRKRVKQLFKEDKMISLSLLKKSSVFKPDIIDS